MLWEVEIQTRDHDPERERVCDAFNLLAHNDEGARLITRSARGYLLQGDIGRKEVDRLGSMLLIDSLVETGRIENLDVKDSGRAPRDRLTVLLKPGVMDPAAMSVTETAREFGIPIDTVRTFRRYYMNHDDSPLTTHRSFLTKVLANDAIEQIVEGHITEQHLSLGTAYQFHLTTVPLRDLGEQALLRLSREGQLSLNLAEMKSIQAYYRDLGREPTDIELETIAQTWSEHCSHKTLAGRVTYTDENGTQQFNNLLKETIFAATQHIRQSLGDDDWCVSVFRDNAGVVKFE